jgi:hypothetical protein
MSDILLKRICKLIAMSYAMNEETVWQIYQDVGSIDKTLETIKNIRNPLEQGK